MRFGFNRYLLTKWPKYIVGPDMPRLAPADPCPAYEAVYFLFDGDELVYIGQSMHLSQRLRKHREAGRAFTSWGFVPVPSHLLTPMETAYIMALRPPMNRNIPPATEAPHDEVFEAILKAWGVSAKTGSPAEKDAETDGSTVKQA